MNQLIKPAVVVVGGINVDIGGKAFGALIPQDSNPGTVSLTLGGVGRNIAHNLRLLGVEVTMLTALGDDLYGGQAAQSCAALGIDLHRARMIPGGRTSTYLYLTDSTGELALAVSDMSICAQITPDYLEENADILAAATAVVADANIPAAALAYLGAHYGEKLMVDPVSVTKAEKLRPILHRIHTLKPNRLEAALLTGMPVTNREESCAAVRGLLDAGVRRVFLSMGSDGVCAGQGSTIELLDALPGRPVNTTGCGDAFMAALLWAALQNHSLRETALAGLAAGAVTMESHLTIAPELSPEALRRRLSDIPL